MKFRIGVLVILLVSQSSYARSYLVRFDCDLDLGYVIAVEISGDFQPRIYSIFARAKNSNKSEDLIGRTTVTSVHGMTYRVWVSNFFSGKSLHLFLRRGPAKKLQDRIMSYSLDSGPPRPMDCGFWEP